MVQLKKKQREIVRSSTMPLMVHRQPSSVVSEQFRTIRTNLMFSMIDKKIKSIVVTSSNTASGKSFIAANLAATFASENKKVMLVDADMRKPTVHRVFGIQNLKGLSTMLTDENAKLEDLVYYTLLPNLHILTSGVIPPNPAELLTSYRMDRLKAQMEAEYDFLIFDMPPVLPVADAQIMAGKVDGTVFVIPVGVASKEEGRKAKKMLEMVQANVLGAIMNRVEPTKDSYYYTSDDSNYE